MTNSARMCSRHNIPCPARCNAWGIPCEDEEGFGDDLAPARGVFRSALIGLAVCGVWLGWTMAVLWLFT